MPGHVIDFAPDGEVSAMHSDKFSLGFLGNQTVRRATEIKFNEETQLWDIWLPTGRTVCLIGQDPNTWPDLFAPTDEPAGLGFSTYDGARKVEVDWLNACRIEGVSPKSEAGKKALKFLRSLIAE